jgi:hypothetical protein
MRFFSKKALKMWGHYSRSSVWKRLTCFFGHNFQFPMAVLAMARGLKTEFLAGGTGGSGTGEHKK